MRARLVLLLVTALSGCAEFWELNSQNPKLSLPPATAADYAPYSKPGTGAISGQAFVLTKSGDPKKAAGKQVTLDPATPLAKAWWNVSKAYQRLEPRLPDDPKFLAARKTTTADAEGRFTFDNLPPGEYLVRTSLQWLPQYCGESSWCGKQSGVMGGLVVLGPGEKKNNVIFGEDARALGDGVERR